MINLLLNTKRRTKILNKFIGAQLSILLISAIGTIVSIIIQNDVINYVASCALQVGAAFAIILLVIAKLAQLGGDR